MPPALPTVVPAVPAPAPVWTRREVGCLLGFLLLVLATRLPFLMHGLDEWDTANFALSLVKFDVTAQQPHAPGQYFYVRLLQGLNWLTGGNDLRTLSLGSTLGSTLALVPLYALLRSLFRPAVAFAAVALTASTFGYWVTSLRMVSDPVACLFVYGAVAALLAGLTNRRWYLAGMVLCGVALGFKQTSVYFLAPLTLAVNVVVAVRAGVRWPLAGSLLFAGTVAGWLVPTVRNVGSMASYLSQCEALQRENHQSESIIFNLSTGAAGTQAAQNLVQPWGATALAVVMLGLALGGLAPLCHRGMTGKLFALFGLTVLLYAFFFLYHFNKYYVYSVPFLCSLAAAALFAASGWLARRAGKGRLADALPAALTAGLVAVNVLLTAPLLPLVNHFRAPPQAALEALRTLRPGAGEQPLVLTDDVTTNRELTYFEARGKLTLVSAARDLAPAVAALNSARVIFFLTPGSFDAAKAPGGRIRQLGHYAWNPRLYQPLQGRPDLRALNLYELLSPLPTAYRFGDRARLPPLLARGTWEDGWCGARTELLLPCPDPEAARPAGDGSDFVELIGTVPGDLGFTFPDQLTFTFGPDGPSQTVAIERPGPFDVVLPLPHPAGARAVEVDFSASQTAQPAQRHPGQTADQRELALRLDSVRTLRAAGALTATLEAGWLAPESDGDARWRWMSGEAVLAVNAACDGTLVLEGEARTAVADNAVELRLDDQPLAAAPAVALASTSPWEPVRFQLPVTAGAHRLTLRSRRPGVRFPGDGRTLAICVRDLRWQLDP